MKTAIVYFEGKEVCLIDHTSISQLYNHDEIIEWTRFYLEDKEVGFFTGNYCYQIVENVK